MSFQKHRPEEFIGKGDTLLSSLIQELMTFLTKNNKLIDRTLRLPSIKRNELANVIIEFGEDIHNDIGLWKSYEQYNTEFFGIPLPLTLRKNEKLSKSKFNKYRVRHLLWNIYMELEPNLIIPPNNQDIILLSKGISVFLEENFKEIPLDSGIKKFFMLSNKYGWNIKRKLIWTGIHSYMFRLSFKNYILEKNEKASIPLIDDFINQNTTKWSGLGVIDILAKTLNISKKQCKELRSWYERHAALYKVLSINGEKMKVLNLINDKHYTIMFGDGANPFNVNDFVFGSLVPYNGNWYWSGEQNKFSNLSKSEIHEIKQDFIQKSSKIVYRYHDELRAKVKDSIKEHYNDFVKHFGDDLLIYPDGLTMAAELQKKDRLKYESLPQEKLDKHLKKYNLKNPFPNMSFPQEIIEEENGIAVYFNPEEGQEIMSGFNDIINGFKKGLNLNEDEKEMIRIFIESTSISPNFIRRLIRDYGDESIKKSFLIPENENTYYVEYLFRKYKGHFYRNRYPAISFVN